jgi:hypothetical protein
MERDWELVFFWRREISDSLLDWHINQFQKLVHTTDGLYYWLIFLDEKLRRAELEISI